MPHLLWQHYLMMGSFIASMIGLSLILTGPETPETDHQETEQLLLKFSFAYWMLYCIAVAAQRLIPLEWEALLLGAKLTAVISYLLTFSCVLTLPIHHLSAFQKQAQ